MPCLEVMGEIGGLGLNIDDSQIVEGASEGIGLTFLGSASPAHDPLVGLFREG